MTDLLPQCQGQPDTYTQSSPITRDVRAYWYSPAAVARMIEEARREEREACANTCDLLATAIDHSGHEYTRYRDAERCALAIRKRGEK